MKLNFRVTGDPKCPAIVFLHGFLGSLNDWDEVVAKVENRYRCVSIDLPGHGESLIENDTTGPDMADAAEAVLGVLIKLGLNEANFVGYSMGGRLGLFLSLKGPLRFLSLTLESASPGLKTKTERRSRIELDSKLAERLSQQPMDDFLADWYAQPLFASMGQYPDRLKQLLARRQENKADQLIASLNLLGTGQQPSLWDKLGQLTVPTLLIAGEKDDKFNSIAAKMSSLCPKATVATVPDCGHNVHWERPDEFSQLMLNHIQKNQEAQVG